MDCNWLPELMLYEDYQSWDDYQEAIYKVFCEDFKESSPEFKGQKVKVRYHPIEFGKEEAFFHITCQDYRKDGERVPDFRRCERIKWVRKFIENYNCNQRECEHCEGVKVWREPYKSNSRVHILLEEERYMVVIECRKDYCLLITAFYFEHDHSLNKKLKKYDEYKNELYKAKSASSK